MARDRSVLSFSVAFTDLQRINDLPTALAANADPASSPDAAPRCAAPWSVVLQAFGLNEQAQVDRFGWHPQLRVVWRLHPKPTSDLLRRPLKPQALDDCSVYVAITVRLPIKGRQVLRHSL